MRRCKQEQNAVSSDAGTLLDIGCQKGEFLFWMKQQGWDVHGIEFSETPPNMFNMPIHYGRVETAAFKPGSFDAITLWAVLEHVHDPIETLGQVKRLRHPRAVPSYWFRTFVVHQPG